MKAVLQRVKSASVTVNDQLVSTIGRGILVLAGVGKGDDEKEAENLVSKVLKMRLWPDDNGGQVSWPGAEASVICVWTTAKNRTVEEERAGYRGRDTLWYVIFPVPGLDITSPDKQSVSQFTLYGQMKKGSKPDFHEAADVETARRLYDYFYQRLREAYKPERVKNGVFQAMMDVELKNDGPVGLNYRSYEEAVTIEVDTRQPKKEKKPEEGNNKEADSSQGEAGKARHEFTIPAELLQ